MQRVHASQVAEHEHLSKSEMVALDWSTWNHADLAVSARVRVTERTPEQRRGGPGTREREANGRVCDQGESFSDGHWVACFSPSNVLVRVRLAWRK